MTCRSSEERAARAAYMRDYYHTHPEYAESVRAAARKRHHRLMAAPKTSERERARGRDKYQRLYRRPRPVYAGTAEDKRKARSAVNNALRDGQLVKPEACEGEGCEARHELEAHHEDYSKPLTVTWLCTKCHAHPHMVP